MANNTSAVLGSATPTTVATTVAAASVPHYGIIKRAWTNAEVVTAGGGATTANLSVGKLPANSRVIAAYMVNDTQATFAAGTLTGSVGVAGTDYVDWVKAGSLKATAATVYGDASAELGTGVGILYYPTAKDIYLQILGGAGDLANVTTCTGTVYIEYVTLP